MKTIIILLVCLFWLFPNMAQTHETEPLLIGVTDMEKGMRELHSMGVPVRRGIGLARAIAVNGNAEHLRRLPFVRYVESDPPDAMWIDEDTLGYGPEKIDAEVVWGGYQGAVNVILGMGGAGVRVAIIDTGIDCGHPDLAGQCYYGASFVDGVTEPFDDYGHGTHVAGIVAMRDNGFGYLGVAPEAEVYAVKVLSSAGSGSLSAVAAGIDWAVENGMDIINLSLGGSPSQAVADAILAASQAGLFLAVSAGNSGCCNTVGYPGANIGSTTVAATDSNDAIAAFSSTGKQVWIAAPGVGVISTVPTGACRLCSSTGYNSLSGTSMSAPHVAGAAALLLSRGFTADEIRNKLANSAVDLGITGWDMFYGYGRINIANAISASSNVPAGPLDTSPPHDIQFISPIAGTKITVPGTRVTFSATAQDDNVQTYFAFWLRKMINGIPSSWNVCKGSPCSATLDEFWDGVVDMWVQVFDNAANVSIAFQPFFVDFTPPPSPVCGDQSCNGTETCSTCPEDCGACPPPPECEPLPIQYRTISCIPPYKGYIYQQRISTCPGPTWGPWTIITSTCKKGGKK